MYYLPLFLVYPFTALTAFRRLRVPKNVQQKDIIKVGGGLYVFINDISRRDVRMMEERKKWKLLLITFIAILAYISFPLIFGEDVDSKPLGESELLGKWGDFTFNSDNTVSAPDDRYFTINWEVSNSANNEVRIRYSVSDYQLDLYKEEIFMEYIDEYEDGYWPTKEDLLYEIREEEGSLEAPYEGLYKFNRTEHTLTHVDDDMYVLEKSGVAADDEDNKSLLILGLIAAVLYCAWKLYDSTDHIEKKSKENRSYSYTDTTSTYSPYKPKRSGYIRSGWTRHDAFSQILHDNPPRSEYQEGDIVVLNVKFKAYGHTYCYRANDNVYKPGDLVEVNVNGFPKVVTVDSVGYYSEDEYPFDVVQLNYVEGMASGELAERYKEAIAEEVGTEEERKAIREAAAEELKNARADKAEADEQRKEAGLLKTEAEQARSEARAALKETDAALEKARRDYAKRETAEREAAKPWKHSRPKADNYIIASLRRVQDALDEDEQIYRKLSDLEIKMTKVINKANELVDEDNWENVTVLINKLYDFYLPKTIFVLEKYENIFSSGLPAESVKRLREELFSAIDKSAEVYNNILISLYERDILELTSEMKALQAMFAREGLLNSDFDL